MVSYYPASFNISEIVRKYPELEMVDEDEVERLEDVIEKKKRGKGAPKKAKSKGIFTALFHFHKTNCRSYFTEESRRMGKKR